MPEQSNSNVAEFFSPGPGERLRAARLSMGYDLAKLASELHLTTPVVEALEADDYSDVGARVFVRGYLRNYARIVGVPVESILRQFDEKWPDDTARQQYTLRESPKLPADGGPGRGWAGVMTWLVVIGIVVLFLMWWRGYLDGVVPQPIRSSSLVENETAAAPESPVPAQDALGFEEGGLPADGSLRLPPPPPDVAPENGATAPDDAASTPAAASAAPAGGSAAVQGSLPAGAGDAPPAAQDPSGLAAADTGPAETTQAGTAAADGGKQIVMSFSAPCWVDVRDSEREFKLFGEMPKGTRKVLGGEPPYKMVIGNARAVTITVNGEPFDLASYAKGNVARFTLDP